MNRLMISHGPPKAMSIDWIDKNPVKSLETSAKWLNR